MGKNLLVGVGGKARKAKALYVGVGGKARKVKKVYVGVGGKARLVYTSYIPLTDIDLVLPDDITQLTVTITAVFTPSDATDQRVTWELYALPGADITIISTTETTCTLKTSSINGGLTVGRLKATTTNGSMSVSKDIRHNPANFLNKNGTWSW